MTEQDWLTSTDPMPILDFLQGTAKLEVDPIV